MTAALRCSKRSSVTALRRHIRNHRRLAAGLFAIVLLMKLIVPGGYMPVARDGRITIAICSGTGAQAMVMTLPGRADHAPDHSTQSETPCAFAGLSLPSLAAVDTIVLAAAIAFAMAVAFRFAVVARPVTPTFLRPPPRAPPVPS